MLEKDKPEKLILKAPKWLAKLLRRPSVAFCMTRMRAILLTIVFFVSLGIFELIVARVSVAIPFPTVIVLAAVWASLFLYIVLLLLPTIFIRKECFECQLGFHILAHERNHLILRKSENVVEEETLKQTADRFSPILLSNPKLCNDCPLSTRKMYSLATFNYLSNKDRRSNN